MASPYIQQTMLPDCGEFITVSPLCIQQSMLGALTLLPAGYATRREGLRMAA